MLSCWSIFPEQRPLFAEISQALNSLLDKADTHLTLICANDQKQHCVIEMTPPTVSPTKPKQVCSMHLPLPRWLYVISILDVV